MISRSEICLFTLKLETVSPRKASEMGRGTDNTQPLYARPELVPRENEAGKTTTKKVPALRMAYVHCSHKGANPQGMRHIMLIIWKLSSKSPPGMKSQRKPQEKFQTHGLKGPESTNNKCLNCGVLSAVRKDYLYLKFVKVTW